MNVYNNTNSSFLTKIKKYIFSYVGKDTINKEFVEKNMTYNKNDKHDGFKKIKK